MTAILGHVRRDRWQFRDLVAARVADVVTRVQAMVTMATRLRHHVYDRVHALDRHEQSMVAWMSGLATGLAPALGAPTPDTLLTGEAIG
jgi:hypothetical protein